MIGWRWTGLVVVASMAACGGGGGGGGGSGGSAVEPPDYAFVYDPATIHEFEIELTQANWTALQSAPETYVPGTLKFGAETYANVGVRFKGNSSLSGGNDKKPFKIHMNEYDATLRFHGFKKLNFHNGFKDPSLIREKIAYELMESAGAAAPKAAHIRLYVTVPGVYAKEYFGVYTNTEQPGKSFCKDRFNDDDGNLYKGESGADCKYLGASQSLYTTKYELQTNETAPDYSGLIHFLDVLNNTPIATLKTELDKVLNVDPMLAVLAVNALLSSLDSYSGGGHNYFLYHNLSTGKFEFIPWDTNETFGQFKSGWTNAELLAQSVYAPYSKGETGVNRPLVYRVLQVPEYKAVYEAKVRALLNGPFTSAALDPRMDELVAFIQIAAYADTHKDYTNAEFDASLTTDMTMKPGASDLSMGLKPFVVNRWAAVNGQVP